MLNARDVLENCMAKEPCYRGYLDVQNFFWQFQRFFCFLCSDHMLEALFHRKDPWRSYTLLSLFIREQSKITLQEQHKIFQHSVQVPFALCFPITLLHQVESFSHMFPQNSTPLPQSSNHHSLPVAQLLLALCLNAPPKLKK